MRMRTKQTTRSWLLLLSLVAACGSSPAAQHPPATVPASSTVTRADTGAAAEAPRQAEPTPPSLTDQAESAPSAPTCPQKPLPKGCPATAPNVNHPCSHKGLECTYAPGCCPSPVYVCNASRHFEARFTRCR